jgi:hypothetical protein
MLQAKDLQRARKGSAMLIAIVRVVVLAVEVPAPDVESGS